MAKLSKREAKAHAEACEVLKKDKLTTKEKWFVLENWQEGANHVNSVAGAFFTPPDLAGDFSIDAWGGRRVLDLCAGAGTLSFALRERCLWGEVIPEFVCVEMNPDYIAVGKKILPEATWLQCSVFDLPAGLGSFSTAISNPPFGSTQRGGGKAPRYSGNRFEYHVIDIASDYADHGAFIIPQMSAPFTYSGKQNFTETKHAHYLDFVKQTAVELTNGCGIDTEYHRENWHGVSPATEVVCCDFEEARKSRAPAQQTLFAEAAE